MSPKGGPLEVLQKNSKNFIQLNGKSAPIWSCLIRLKFFVSSFDIKRKKFGRNQAFV